MVMDNYYEYDRGVRRRGRGRGNFNNRGNDYGGYGRGAYLPNDYRQQHNYRPEYDYRQDYHYRRDQNYGWNQEYRHDYHHYPREHRDHHYDNTRSNTPPVITPKAILVKPDSERNHAMRNGEYGRIDNLPIMVVKKIVTNNNNGKEKGKPVATSMLQIVPPETVRERLAVAPEMRHALKIIDENNIWYDAALQKLIDRTDFLTIGAIGMQGSGKSSILAHLAGNKFSHVYKKQLFKFQAEDVRAVGGHQTFGIDLGASQERLILLDSQPLISPSVLDYMIRNEKKYSQEYITAENFLEMQSIQFTAFMLSVCQIVFVVMDWFIDSNLIRMLLSAEMIKPNIHSSHQDYNYGEPLEHFPKIVFILNKAGRGDFNGTSYRKMQTYLAEAMKDSKLRYRGYINAVELGMIGDCMPNKGGERNPLDDVNLYLLPDNDEHDDIETTIGQGVFSLIPPFHGHCSYHEAMRKFRERILATEREPILRALMSEKTWFHYSARVWENIKKSHLAMDFNRLLP